MIISSTPFRISFFGGGTDFREWYSEHGGKILSTTINKYCHIFIRHLPPFFEEKSRFIWSKIENVPSVDKITHPAARAILKHYNAEHVEVMHSGDLPARSGMGSSSAFTVGLLNAVHALQEAEVSAEDLAREAIRIEREVLKENVGIQDQVACSIGGYNRTIILPNGEFRIDTLDASDEFKSHFLLFFTGVTRFSSDVAAEQLREMKHNTMALKEMSQMVDLAIKGSLEDFGRLLHENWLLKRSLSKAISTDFIDQIYERGIKAGALGGKLLGAGGGGFILFFAKPENHSAILSALKGLLWVPFEFEKKGARIIFNG